MASSRPDSTNAMDEEKEQPNLVANVASSSQKSINQFIKVPFSGCTLFFKKKLPANEPNSSRLKFTKLWRCVREEDFIRSKISLQIEAATAELFLLFLGAGNSPKTRCVIKENGKSILLQEEISIVAHDYQEFINTEPGYVATAMVSGLLADIDLDELNYGLVDDGVVKRCDFEYGLHYYALALPILPERVFNLNKPPYDFYNSSQNEEEYLIPTWAYRDDETEEQEKFDILDRMMHMPITRMAQALFKHFSEESNDLVFTLLLRLEERQRGYQRASQHNRSYQEWAKRTRTSFDLSEAQFLPRDQQRWLIYQKWKKTSDALMVIMEISQINHINNWNKLVDIFGVKFKKGLTFNWHVKDVYYRYQENHNTFFERIFFVCKLLTSFPITEIKPSNSPFIQAYQELEAYYQQSPQNLAMSSALILLENNALYKTFLPFFKKIKYNEDLVKKLNEGELCLEQFCASFLYGDKYDYENIHVQDRGKTEAITEFLHAAAACRNFGPGTNYSMYDYVNSELTIFGMSAAAMPRSSSTQFELTKPDDGSFMQIEPSIRK